MNPFNIDLEGKCIVPAPTLSMGIECLCREFTTVVMRALAHRRPIVPWSQVRRSLTGTHQQLSVGFSSPNLQRKSGMLWASYASKLVARMYCRAHLLLPL